MESLSNIKAKRKLQQEMMAKALMQGTTVNPGENPMKAWAPVMQVIGGQIADKRLAGQEKEAQERYRTTLADALVPGADLGKASSSLMQNPDTSDMGLKLFTEGVKQRGDQDFKRTEAEANRQNLRDIARMNIEGRQSVAEMAAASRGKPNPATLQKIQQKKQQINALKMQLQKVKEAFEGKTSPDGQVSGGLKDSFSAGYGTGWLPTESGQAFDKAVAMLSPLARQISRTPGEGAMSDYESRLVQQGLPDRNAHESTTAKQIADWEDLISVLESGYSELSPEQKIEQPALLPTPGKPSGRIRFDASGNRIP